MILRSLTLLEPPQTPPYTRPNTFVPEKGFPVVKALSEQPQKIYMNRLCSMLPTASKKDRKTQLGFRQNIGRLKNGPGS